MASRRKRKRRRQRRAELRERLPKQVEQKPQPGTASDHMHHLPELLRQNPDRPCVLSCRVSTVGQERDGTLGRQIRRAKEELRALDIRLGGRLVAVYHGVESSHIDEERPLLKESLEDARVRNAILISLSRDRFLRSSRFDGTTKSELPTNEEYEELKQLADGVPLATIRHPDDSPSSVRSKQIKDGQEATGRKGGRPRNRKMSDEQWEDLRAAWDQYKQTPP